MSYSNPPRIVVCGAVDDGKSTLIGRLLAETGSIPSDELSTALLPDGSVDYSRLTDGLEAEREQGITIDVAYRYLRLPNGARVLLADSPGHDQYTRNMAVAASTADVGLIVVDIEKGISNQTKRHASICFLMGVQALVVAINKIDSLPEAVAAQKIENMHSALDAMLHTLSANIISKDSGPLTISVVPVSGLRGDNVMVQQNETPSLIETLEKSLETIAASNQSSELELRLPIQAVIRHDGQRFYSGRISIGNLAVHDEVVLWPSLHKASVAELFVNGTSASSGTMGDSVAVRFDHEVDLSRADIVIKSNDYDNLSSSRAHLTNLVWISPEEMSTTTSYLLRVGPLEIPVKCDVVRYQIDLETNTQSPATHLSINEIGCVEISADRAFLLDPYRLSRDTGGFVLCDRLTGNTVAAGMAIHLLQRTSEVTRHAFTVTREERENLNGVRAGVLWLTGLPGSGKSSIADELERKLFEKGIRSFVLDGDTVRQTLSTDLGFSPEDRAENVRRVAQVAHMMMEAGLIVIVSLVSPSASDREAARELFAHSDFAEVFVDTPLEVCQSRDPKGLYARAAQDSTTAMTGVGQNYEPPVAPDIYLAGTADIAENSAQLLDWVMKRRV